MGNIKKFSPQYIDALAECITGGSGYATGPRIGIYRSGTEIIKFFRSLGYDVTSLDGFSRVPFTQDLLTKANQDVGGLSKIIKATEKLLDPRGYVGQDDKLQELITHLNSYLGFDGMEIVKVGSFYKVMDTGGTAPVTEFFGSATLSLPSVKADFERALQAIDHDPGGAITSACSTLESVAKSILDGLEKPYPKDESIQHLIACTTKELDLSPDDHSEAEIKRVLGGLANVAAGIGVLRTKYGDAHGKGKEFAQLLPRHARLAINAASTIGLFLLESYVEMKG